jgi:hypothetical protein
MEGKRHGRARWAVIASAIACAVIGGVLASPAAAFHIPGAAYSGQVAGGGNISFSVSADGSSVTNLTLTGPIPGPSCTLDSRQYSQPAPITDHGFNNGEVSGSFPNVQGAYGHLNVVVSGLFGDCRLTNGWSAVTRTDPAGSEECKSARARARKWKRALAKAKRSGNEPKIKKLQKKWKHARARRDQFC